MDETDSELLHKISEAYWLAFGRLIADHLKLAPEDLWDDLMMRLQEKSSVYSSCCDKWLK